MAVSDLPQECGATGLQVPGGELWPWRSFRPVPLPTAPPPHLSPQEGCPPGRTANTEYQGQEGREAQAASTLGVLEIALCPRSHSPSNKQAEQEIQPGKGDSPAPSPPGPLTPFEARPRNTVPNLGKGLLTYPSTCELGIVTAVP